MSRYDRQFQAAAANYDSACPCCDHAPKATAPDGDLYADGWTPGKTKFPAMTAQPVRGSDDDYWGVA